MLSQILRDWAPWWTSIFTPDIVLHRRLGLVLFSGGCRQRRRLCGLVLGILLVVVKRFHLGAFRLMLC